jgi:hypothetical protein
MLPGCTTTILEPGDEVHLTLEAQDFGVVPRTALKAFRHPHFYFAVARDGASATLDSPPSQAVSGGYRMRHPRVS